MMKFSANKKGLAALVLSLVLALSLAACGSNPYDEFLGDYEKFVVKVEDMAKKGEAFTSEKMDQFTKDAQEFAAKAQKVTTSAKPSDAQVARMNELTQRYVTAIQKLASTPAPTPPPAQ